MCQSRCPVHVVVIPQDDLYLTLPTVPKSLRFLCTMFPVRRVTSAWQFQLGFDLPGMACRHPAALDSQCEHHFVRCMCIEKQFHVIKRNFVICLLN